MLRYWTDFAKTGAPSGASGDGGDGDASALPPWQPFTMEESAWQVFGPEGSVGSERIPADRITLYDLADSLYPDGVMEALANSPDGGLEGIWSGNSTSR
mmetsp:Transcript_29146/g.61615  ORF Transcript_29146/g.61615 Transcript_29146/m.61615 type:complete len:99 (+) Transcript_29146:2-298(+)